MTRAPTPWPHVRDAADALSASFDVSLPGWLLQQMADADLSLTDVEDRMRLVNLLAERNHREGTGGPFAALVANAATGEIVSVGVNLVLASGLSGMHAEVVALSLAQRRLRSWDLGGPAAPVTELLVNWRPCAMCYGAVLWSGVRRLVIAGEGDDVELLTGFDEGPMRPDWKEQLATRGIAVRTGVLRDEALAVFRAYGQRTDVTVYNARRGPTPVGPDVAQTRP